MLIILLSLVLINININFVINNLCAEKTSCQIPFDFEHLKSWYNVVIGKFFGSGFNIQGFQTL